MQPLMMQRIDFNFFTPFHRNLYQYLLFKETKYSISNGQELVGNVNQSVIELTGSICKRYFKGKLNQ
jgi:hypothetical protein